MAKSALELAVETGKWDAGLKKAKSALDSFTDANGGLQQALGKDSDKMQKFVQMMGGFESTAKTAKGQMNDYKGTIEALTMQYNRMTDAQKAAIGQDYLRSIDQMRQKYQAVAEEVQKINQSLSQTPKADALSNAMPSGGGLFGSDKLSGMLQVFGGNVMTKIAGAGLNFASELGDMVQQGIELARAGEGVRIAFERLGRGDILDGLRQATHGTVTDLELMKAAVKFNDFKLPLDQLGTMLAFAQQKAKDTGQSVDYMVDSIVTGLGRKSLMILDNLGLSASEVKERMAETGDMTKAVGAIIREQMSKAGDYVETAADRAAQANVSLQNKMEELGRKFGPLEQASSNLWTSIKIGIMDIVGGPLTEFLNKLTEAGRLAQQYGVLGGSAKVGRMVNNLANTREDRRQSVYQQQQAEIWKLINPREQQIKDIRAWQRGERGDALKGRINAIREKYGSLDATKIQSEVDAYKKVLSDYQQAVKPLLNPIKPEVDTSDAEQSIDSLNKKLKELQAQRKKAIASGDKQKSADLLKQINQTKNDIKGLGGSTTTTTTTHQTPQQRAQESFTKAEQNYKQALEKAAMELEAGTINRAQAKQQEAQAAEQRWKAIGDARNISDSDSLRQAQDEAAAEYKRLAAEAKTATEHQKAVDKATRDLENANQKLATARSEMAQARQHGDLQAYNTAKDKATAAQKEITRLEKVKVDVERGKVDLPDIPKEIEQIVNTHQGELMTAEIAKEITQTINTRLGRIVTPDILESITQTINTKIGRVVKPEILEQITQTINTKIGKVATPPVAKEVDQTVNTKQGKLELADIPTELTQTVDVETGRVDLKPIPTELTQTVDVEQGDVNLPAIPDVITQTINTKVGEILTPEVAAEVVQTINTRLGRIVTPDILESITQTINTKIGRVVTPDILESITQTINTKIGKVVTPAIAKELTQEVNVKTGKVDLKPIPTEITQKVDVEQGDVNLPAIPAEVTQTVDVETGRVNLLNIPEVIEQTVNTHQGELMTADIATEITQKINTVLGNIVKPEILDEVTQTINTKVGEVITPEIAKEVTQVVNVETGTVDLEPIPTETTTKVDFQADTRNINAAISDVKKEMDTIPVGTIKFNLDQTKLVDLTTLKTLIDEQVKNGLEIDPEATQGLFSKIQLGVDIEDTTWQDLIDKINEKLKELDIEPISINFKTGDTAKTGKETENAWKNAASAVQSVGSALQQIEDPSAKIVGIIGQAIANIALGFAQATAASSGGGIFAWIAAIAGGLATMISTISAIHSATGYADGGIVKGNTYSGDQIPALVDGSQMVGLNAGEVVLNRSQQGVLAASLQAVGQSGEGGGGGRPYVSGELIWLGLNNYLNRSGRGEIVTSKRR